MFYHQNDTVAPPTLRFRFPNLLQDIRFCFQDQFFGRRLDRRLRAQAEDVIKTSRKTNMPGKSPSLIGDTSSNWLGFSIFPFLIVSWYIFKLLGFPWFSIVMLVFGGLHVILSYVLNYDYTKTRGETCSWLVHVTPSPPKKGFNKALLRESNG